MGTGSLSWRLCDFYPIAQVYEQTLGNFDAAPLSAIGEAGFSDCSDYRVTLNAPETYEAAASGRIISRVGEGSRTIWTIEADAVRDFAIVLGRKYSVFSDTTSGGVEVRVLSNNASRARAALAEAVRAIELYSDWFGQYPFDKLDIAQTELITGAASYPGLILINGNSAQALVNHAARQWFGCAVGTNRFREPWLCDAVCAYAALLYTRHFEGESRYMEALNARVLESLNITIPGGAYVDNALNRFMSASEYEIVVIDRGAAVLHRLSAVMGNDVFLSALGIYARTMKNKNAGIADFARALEEASGRNWDDYLVLSLRGINEYMGSGIEWFE